MCPSDSLLQPGKLPGPLLQRLIETYRTGPDPSVRVATGYGRDAAAIDASGESVLVVKSDPITFATDNSAHYLVAVNANDIACMGADPRWLTVVALLPADSTTESSVEKLFSDLRDACDRLGVSLIGGHTEVTPGIDRPLLIGTMLGTTESNNLIEPGGAKPGDCIYMTQFAALEGTAILATELRERLQQGIAADALDAAGAFLHDPGISVVSAARALRNHHAVRAMHDPTEGGVATAVHEIAEAAGIGASLVASRIPVRAETAAIADFLKIDPLGMLSSGALLLAIDAELRLDFEEHARHHAVPVAHIGEFVQSGFTLVTDTGTVPLPRFDRDEVSRVL